MTDMTPREAVEVIRRAEKLLPGSKAAVMTKIDMTEAIATLSALADRAGWLPVEMYHELLYAVPQKVPGESRHETALRLIRQSQSVACGPTAAPGASHE